MALNFSNKQIVQRSATTLSTGDEILILNKAVIIRDITRIGWGNKVAIRVRDIVETGQDYEILAPLHKMFDVLVVPPFTKGTIINQNGTKAIVRMANDWIRAEDDQVTSLTDSKVRELLEKDQAKIIFEPSKTEIVTPKGVALKTVFAKGTAVRWNGATMLRTSIVDKWVYDYRGNASSASDKDVADAIKSGVAHIIFEPLTQGNGQWSA